MKGTIKFSRRRFIQGAAVALAAGPSLACRRAARPYRFLSADEANTLAAICDHIIPEDQDPGAVSAGVVDYIDRQLCGFFKNLRNLYRQGIAEMNVRCIARYGERFASLPSQRQAEFLTMLDRDEAWKGTSLQTFFKLVVTHTMQGFYGDPRHGGNRDRVSWKMVGLPYPPIRGQLQNLVNAAGDAGIS
jgi:gluconate 2-dehydrogenase gamma chain